MPRPLLRPNLSTKPPPPAQAWLINTGWTGGAYGVGSRISLRYTRAIVDAIHSGALLSAPTHPTSIFNLQVRPCPACCTL